MRRVQATRACWSRWRRGECNGCTLRRPLVRGICTAPLRHCHWRLAYSTHRSDLAWATSARVTMQRATHVSMPLLYRSGRTAWLRAVCSGRSWAVPAWALPRLRR